MLLTENNVSTYDGPAHEHPAARQRTRQDRSALRRLLAYLADTDYHFTTVTPATHARINARAENRWARTVQDVLGWNRPFMPDALPLELLSLLRHANLLEPHGKGYKSCVRVSTLMGRLFVHSAYPTDQSDAVFFGPDTYRFARAIRAHLAARPTPVQRAADIGCGSGAGAILIASAFEDAQVMALDINDNALDFTRVNAFASFTPNVQVAYSDVLQDVEGEFDLIIANPPYLLDASERTYRHGGGAHGEALSLRIVREAVERLAVGGSLVLYTGVAICGNRDPFLDAVRALLPAAELAYSYEEVDPDVFPEELDEAAYRDADRIAAVVLTVTRLLAKDEVGTTVH